MQFISTSIRLRPTIVIEANPEHNLMLLGDGSEVRHRSLLSANEAGTFQRPRKQECKRKAYEFGGHQSRPVARNSIGLSFSYSMKILTFSDSCLKSNQGCGRCFSAGIASLPLQMHQSEIASHMASLPSRGYSGILVENNCAGWLLPKVCGKRFNGGWQFWRISDTTFRSASDFLQSYSNESREPRGERSG